MTSILKADNIQDADGNNIINESSNTITIGASGDTTNVIGTLNKDGVAVTNTPAFQAYLNANQGSISADTFTKVAFDTEEFDSDGNFDTSTSRFTPTTAGKYLVTVNLYLDGGGQGNLRIYAPVIQKNGSTYAQAGDDKAQGYQNNGTETLSVIVDMNGSSDYLEVFMYHFTQDNSSSNVGGANTEQAMFTAHKLIGV